MLSILILTHNRPKLFKRCLNSVLNNLPKYVEIIVNNDSNDIIEIDHLQVTYHYYKSNNLSNVYKFLLDKSNNDMIMYLEDDDYLVKTFWKNFTRYFRKDIDLYYMNYIPVANSDLKIGKEFKIEKENNLFQLSQIIFNKNNVSSFPDDNNIYNDWKLFQQVKTNKIQLIKVPMFVQTTDGHDNISFKEFNNDKRFN